MDLYKDGWKKALDDYDCEEYRIDREPEEMVAELGELAESLKRFIEGATEMTYGYAEESEFMKAELSGEKVMHEPFRLTKESVRAEIDERLSGRAGKTEREAIAVGIERLDDHLPAVADGDGSWIDKGFLDDIITMAHYLYKSALDDAFGRVRSTMNG